MAAVYIINIQINVSKHTYRFVRRPNGTVLEIPVKKGDQVIQANTFNAGTTIAIIAD